jgi:hypothetical protein
MRSCVLCNILNFIGNESRENISKGLRTLRVVYIICICNVLNLSDYCVTIKNELLATFASLEVKLPSALFCL